MKINLWKIHNKKFLTYIHQTNTMDTISRHKTNNSKKNYSRLTNTQIVEFFFTNYSNYKEEVQDYKCSLNLDYKVF